MTIPASIKSISQKAFDQINLALSERSIGQCHLDNGTSLLQEAMLELRKETGMTARQFGSLCGVSKAYIYALEKKIRPWNDKLVSRILEAISSKT
jgi:hypothetical protein